ncbi:MAG: polysaccharide deacetylase family protein [Gemmatimonadaceae bacterium]
MRGILTYHSVDSSGSAISVDAESFRDHVRWLASGRVQVLPIEQLLLLPPEADAVALTFDDGFENFGTIAAPLLLEHALPVTLFIVTDRVGKTSAWGGRDDPRAPTLPLLGWHSIGKLAETGVSIGAHSHTHPFLSRIEGSELEGEILGCRDRIERELGRVPEAFAYPYGDLHAASADLVARSYRWGCTTDLRTLAITETPERLPRVDAYYLRAKGRLEGWGSPAFRRQLWIRSCARVVRARMMGLRRS